MLITPVLVLLLVLLFYKRPVNDVVGWTPPPRTLWQDPPAQGTAGPGGGQGAPQGPGQGQGQGQDQAQSHAQSPTSTEVPMDLNDLLGGRKGPTTSQPRR